MKIIWGKKVTQSSVTTFTTLRYSLYIITLQLALQFMKKKAIILALNPYLESLLSDHKDLYNLDT